MKVFEGQLLSLSYQSSMASYHVKTQSSYGPIRNVVF